MPQSATTADVLAVVFDAYSNATGQALPANPDTGQKAAVEEWLRTTDPATAHTLGITRQSIHSYQLHLTTAAKASHLAQLACPACGPRYRVFPVDVDPWSAQSDTEKVAIRTAVNSALSAAGAGSPWEANHTDPVCISIVAVVRRHGLSHPRKDTDNLVKGLLDAFEGVLYRNDSQVQCLTVHRLEYSGTRGHYMVGVSKAEDFSANVLREDPFGARIRWGNMRDPVD